MTDTLLDLIDRLPARNRLEAWWNAPSGVSRAHGLPLSALPVFAAWLARRSGRPVLALVPDPEGSFGETRAWFADGIRAVVFPAVETLPFDRLAPDEETVRRRIEAIDALAGGGPLVCFTSWTAMTRPTLSPDALRRWAFTLKTGQTYAMDDLMHRLTTLGYRREPLVQGRGEFSLRGGILDCFPPGRRHPVRAEFFGDELESLREFELETQGSVGSVEEARVLPAAELVLTPESVASAEQLLARLDFSRCLPEVRDQWLADVERVRNGVYFDGIEGFQAYLDPTQPTLIDHLPPEALVVCLDARRSLTQAHQREQELAELVATEIERGELPQGLQRGLLTIESLRVKLARWRTAEVERAADAGSHDLGLEPADADAGRSDASSDRRRSDAGQQARSLVGTPQG